MSRLFAPLLLILMPLFAADDGAITWNYKDEVELKKDQRARYMITIDSKLYTLDFRWTLYVNKGLVMLYKYGTDTTKINGFPYQNILYKDHKLNSFKIKLKNRASNAFLEPYALVLFKEFDDKTKKATISVMMKDDIRPVQAERVLPKVD
jgi:hypothetical protein